MVDVHSKAVRSKNMRAIQARHSWPERYVRRILHHSGFRFRCHPKDLPAKPDIYLPKYQAVILVNSCFWHGHNCHLFHWPSTNKKQWREKITETRRRDQRNLHDLSLLKIRTLIVWECALKGRKRLSEKGLSERLEEWLLTIQIPCEISSEGLFAIADK